VRTSKIKEKLKANEPVLLTAVKLRDSTIHELISLMGFDGIWMDMEHHSCSLETAADLMRVARLGGAEIVARCAKGEFMRLGRMLEAGAQGIMYPRCENDIEAAEVVKWAKFPPLGSRGADGGNPDMPYATMPLDRYIRQANEQTFVVILVEDEQAVQNAEAIAAVEGVDVLMFGPGDFTVQTGIAGQFDHPAVQGAIEKVAKAARNTGKQWGMPFATVEQARLGIEMGARFILHSADVLILQRGLEQMQTEFGILGFRFLNRLSSSSRSHVEQPAIGLKEVRNV